MLGRLLLLAFALGVAFAQPVRKASPFSDDLTAAVAVAPAEIGADLILTALDRPGLLTSGERLEFLERADSLIRQAKYPAAIVGLVPAARGTDSELGMLAQALGRGLDRRSLTARLVVHYLPFDRLRAREALLDIRFQPIPALTCADGFAWTSQPISNTLRQVLDSGFSREERDDGRDIQFLLDFIYQSTHPAALEPLIETLRDFHGKRDDFQAALSALSFLFAQWPVDPRSAEYLLAYSLSQRFQELQATARKFDTDFTAPLVEFRKLLERIGKLTQCEDSSIAARPRRSCRFSRSYGIP